MPSLVTVVELHSFTRDAEDALTPEQLDELKIKLAAKPTTGTLIKNTGGVRKIRIAASGRGKRGGGRVIYYFYNEDMPLFLLAFFAKSEKADLSAAERKAAKQVAESLVAEFLPRK